MRDPKYDILFEPVQIGPVKTKNRFYQVPHCNGMGHVHPSAMAGMRAVKAEGGWGVVCTEECEISPLSEFSPYIEARLWEDRDVPALARMADAVHQHGSLAGIELAFNGYSAPNRYSREIPWAPSNTPVRSYDPVQARAMTASDIRELRNLHRAAALRARDAGFDIIYVYAGHDLGLPFHFLTPRNNRRTDEYGGSVENRVRLLRELIEDTKEAVGDRCGVAVRLAVDEQSGREGLEKSGDGAAIFSLLAELPDLWDINVADWSNDSITARFSNEGFQEEFLTGLKALTSKPIVGVGRFTSPDTMVSQIRRGVLDLIGAARPSIADPFLPRKIETGRADEIRECIGCNICVTGDHTSTPVRCTQNPTMGEEWRRGWHPERIQPKRSDSRALVIGSGPAGLECARALGTRGYDVALVEATRTLGGRLVRETRLPGLASWGRVIDYRVDAIGRLENVEIYRESQLTADDVMDFGAEHVFVATGSRWRNDGLGREIRYPLEGLDQIKVLTPDDVLAGADLPAKVVLFDDDHYYMGSALAELLRMKGIEVTFVTPATDVSAWTHNTLEQHRIQKRLLELGVQIITAHSIERLVSGGVSLSCIYTGRTKTIEGEAVLLVTSREPEQTLYDQLLSKAAEREAAGIRTVKLIGDCNAPGTVAAAVYAGHRAARLTDGSDDNVYFKRELPALDAAFI
ncbi:FAD-dependent oxidoreductase [Ensifer adhaerens]|uniref:oxidoreductase n=1 Tax=Ensifer adhaerens TaxID=106592 RepID=UPI000DC4E052|nr:FAD-dependent oxidoreductase [Ensifer adhaerens]RAR99188.1 2,4-dienoyl-CoA reductase-like NADH-dependent reductase (Old Yellow Enzyme family) [Ensifer adhaerens]